MYRDISGLYQQSPCRLAW